MMKHATKLILVTLAGITLFAAVPAMAEEAPVHLKWYVGGSAPQSDVDTVAAAMSDYVNEKYGLNIELEITCVDFGSYPDKMQMVIASGEEYDLCWTSSWCNNYYVNVGKNAYLPLDELLKEYGQDMMAEIPKGVWEGARVSGSIYAVPSWQIRRSGISEVLCGGIRRGREQHSQAGGSRGLSVCSEREISGSVSS